MTDPIEGNDLSKISRPVSLLIWDKHLSVKNVSGLPLVKIFLIKGSFYLVKAPHDQHDSILLSGQASRVIFHSN